MATHDTKHSRIVDFFCSLGRYFKFSIPLLQMYYNMIVIATLALISTVVMGDNTSTPMMITTTPITLISNATDTNTTKGPACENGGICCAFPEKDCIDFPFELNGKKGYVNTLFRS